MLTLAVIADGLLLEESGVEKRGGNKQVAGFLCINLPRPN